MEQFSETFIEGYCEERFDEFSVNPAKYAFLLDKAKLDSIDKK